MQRHADGLRVCPTRNKDTRVTLLIRTDVHSSQQLQSRGIIPVLSSEGGAFHALTYLVLGGDVACAAGGAPRSSDDHPRRRGGMVVAQLEHCRVAHVRGQRIAEEQPGQLPSTDSIMHKARARLYFEVVDLGNTSGTATAPPPEALALRCSF